MKTLYLILIVVIIITARVSGQTWQSSSYYGDPVAEDAVGSTVFDPGIGGTNPQCYLITGTMTLYFVSCGIGDATSYFNFTGNKLILAKAYYLNVSGHSSVLPDCLMSCKDSYTGKTVYATITIYIYVALNRYTPVFNSTFPRQMTINLVYYPQLLTRTDAYDLDVDSATSGRVTYSVGPIDGVTNTSQDSIFYQNYGATPNLYLVKDPGWTMSTTHSIVVLAIDHPLNSTLQKTGTATLTINYVPGTTTKGSNTVTWMTWPSTSSTASTASTASTTASSNTATVTASGLTSTNDSECEGIKLLICGQNWIWLIVAISAFVILVVMIFVISYCMRKAVKRRAVVPKYPPPARYQRPPYQPPAQQAPSYQARPTLPPEVTEAPPRRPNPFLDMYNQRNNYKYN